MSVQCQVGLETDLSVFTFNKAPNIERSIMAIYKGRSVQILSVQPLVEPNLTVSEKDGTVISVKPSELYFTKIEMDRIQKDKADYLVNSGHYKLINDKDHQELLDGQNPAKMEAKLAAKAK